MGEWVDVELVGGPMDGTRQPMEYAAVYEPEAGADPHRWVWRGWVP